MGKITFQFLILLKRLGILLLLYSICRIFFFLVYHNFFSGSLIDLVFAFLTGLRFDIAAIVMVNILFIILHLIPFNFFSTTFYQRLLKYFFYLFNLPALILNIIDIGFFRFTLKRSTGDLVKFVSTGNDTAHLIPQFLKDYWYLLIFFVALILLTEWLYRKVRFRQKLIHKGIPLQITTFLALVTVFVIGARGGLQYKPVSIVNAAEFTSPGNAPLVLNTPFTFIKSIGNKDILLYPEPTVAPELKFNPLNQFNKLQVNKKNVVIIIMEGIGKEYIGSLNHYKGYTPFLDSLCAHSYVFTNAFANGKRSIEGIPAILASLPTLMNQAYITSTYSGNQINSIASILKQEGYHTSFFHGGNNGTMGFDAFTRMAGFEHYYGRNEYNNDEDYDGNWGIWDEKFLQYYSKTLSGFPQPFASSIFTLSSHHPFQLPKEYLNKFKGGPLPIHKTVEYTDYSLRKFFEAAQKTNWYKNTLFVITSDHTALSDHPFYQQSVGLFAIPIIMFDPANPDFKGQNQTTTQQTDIMPAILEKIGYSKPFFTFGNNPFNPQLNHFAINYYNNNFQFIQDNYSYLFDGEKGLALFNYKSDSLLSKNILKDSAGIAKPMDEALRYYIHVYSNALINNQTSIRK